MRVVLLEHPRLPSEHHFNDIANTPLWSCLMTGYSASSLLHAGFEVLVIDARYLSFDETIDEVIGSSPDLLGIHAVYFWERTGELFAMISGLRDRGYGGAVHLYGFFPTLVWKEILEQVPEVDGVVVGEPEQTMVELARSLGSGEVPRVHGLAVRMNGAPMLRGLRPPIDPLDQLPFPFRPCLDAEDTVSVLASRGCYNGCSFCLIPTLDGGRTVWRSRTAANVAAEVAELVERGKRDLYFVDPNFIGPGKSGREGAMNLARALSGLRIAFGMETRANDVTEPLLASLRDGGLKSLLLGIESGSPRVLKRLGKNATVAHNERAIAAVRGVGIEPEIGFIMFEPSSTPEDIAENLRFLERNRLLGRLGRTANLLYHEHIAFWNTPGYLAARRRGALVASGVFGFEGRLLYEDGRVSWLARVMRPICQFILRKMNKELSLIHWKAECEEGSGFKAVNDHLVDLFKRLLNVAAALNMAPDEIQTERLLAGALEELEQTIQKAGAYAGTARRE